MLLQWKMAPFWEPILYPVFVIHKLDLHMSKFSFHDLTSYIYLCVQNNLAIFSLISSLSKPWQQNLLHGKTFLCKWTKRFLAISNAYFTSFVSWCVLTKLGCFALSSLFVQKLTLLHSPPFILFWMVGLFHNNQTLFTKTVSWDAVQIKVSLVTG